MQRIVEFGSQPLSWSQPSAFKMEYELRAGDQIVGTLIFRSSLGSFATGRGADGCWTFKRVGFWQTRATIRECERDSEIGSFRNKTWTGGGTLELPDGRQFLATTNLWQSKLEFQEESGVPLFALKSRGLIHLAADVEIQPQAMRIPEIRWMILFGWYVIVMMHMDSSGVAAAAAG